MRPRSFREAATPLKIIVEVFDDLVDHMKNPVHREVRGIAQAGSALLLGSRGRRFEPCSPDQLVDLRGINSDGRLGEWLKPAVLNTAEPPGSVGSNPTSSSSFSSSFCCFPSVVYSLVVRPVRYLFLLLLFVSVLVFFFFFFFF